MDTSTFLQPCTISPKKNKETACPFPTSRDPITERQRMIGVYKYLLSKVFSFHYHSQFRWLDP